MLKKISNLVNSFWKFDSDQQSSASWNDKQDILKEIEELYFEELADIRNKLGSMNNLLALLESSSDGEKIVISDKLYPLVMSEIKKSKEVIKDIVKKDLEND